ncbi:MAG: sulfurtransferase, partial [Actinobacteria bacterium]|nr:sulfurtransferase [Actinomycetota bacterium]NIS30716.1 sulfurtransferase [Actinomycetota bacterium]NIU18919.1 sulfurtransferase [Actinomycetota bacterium]NIU65931.1 sulfurtransferase [Actinomycetota bacterium]NIV86788.1 sulfurtransferase [Actinomycetota bacterium]
MSLVTTGELAARLDDPSLRIADCRWYLGDGDRGRSEYAEAHIPGAIYVDLERDLSAFPGPGRHPLPDRTAFAERMGALGIGDGHTVVAYDDRGGAVAARLWWMLRDIGHTDVAVLDGGLVSWLADGHPVTDRLPAHEPASLSVRPGPARSIDRAGVAAGGADLVVL